MARPRRLWQEMTTNDFRDPDVAQWIAILPVAAVEQHGPHLPVEVDACINAGVLRRALDRLPQEVPVTVLPPMPVGKSVEHIDFPGTLTLSTETLIRLWIEIGESVARSGVRKLVILNSHGGQPQVVDIVARELRIRADMFVVAANYYALGKPAGLFPEAELKHGIHGGGVETSMMMALRPDLVRREQIANFEPISVALERTCEILIPEGRVGFGWKTQDLHPSGACGDATLADPAKGEALLDNYAERLARLLQEVAAYDLANLRAKP